MIDKVGEMGPKVAKLVNLTQVLTPRSLIMADHSISALNGAKLANARFECTWAENYSGITDVITLFD